MIQFFTQALNYKNSGVSGAAWLKVNTPVLCTSQIRQFGRRRKHFASTWKGALTSTWEGGNLFVCRDCICAQLDLRQNKYMCHIVSRGWWRQSWIEDKKRIRSVTSCANPGFSRLKLCRTWAPSKLPCLYIPLNPHKCLHFHQAVSNSFFRLSFFLSLSFQSSTCISPHFSHESVFFSSSISKRLTGWRFGGGRCVCVGGVNAEHLFQGCFDYISVNQMCAQFYSWVWVNKLFRRRRQGGSGGCFQVSSVCSSQQKKKQTIWHIRVNQKCYLLTTKPVCFTIDFHLYTITQF